MKKLSKNAILLLACLLINGITSTFIYTYLLAFILDVSSNGIVNVAIFYLVLHVTMIILSWIMAPIFKRLSKTLVLKLGIIFKFLFVVIVVYLGDKIANFVYIVAMCNAVSEVMFWGGANPLQTIVTGKTSLTTYMSYSKIFGTMIGLTVPIIMGYCIDQIGMSTISIAMVIIVTTQLILTIFLNEKTEKDNIKLQYKEFIQVAKVEYPQTKQIYKNQFIYGFCTNLSMIILYYTVITFGSNISLGIFSTVSSILSIIIVALYNLKKDVWSKPLLSILCSIAVSISVVFVLITLNKVTLIVFYSFWHIANVIPETITGATRLNITKRDSLKKYHIENITISESFLDLGRVVGEIVLLIMGLINHRIFDIVCLCFVTTMVVVYYIHTSYVSSKNIQKVTYDKQ